VAGAGYKQFADGDVLTAAQVQTFLQDQAVMRFADSSARTTALGTAVAEGMVSYLQDTDTVEVYDGSAWVGVGSDPNPGIGTNVVSTSTGTAATTTSTTFVDVTGMSVSITPTYNTSKVLLVANFLTAAPASYSGQIRLMRDATVIHDGSSGSTLGNANTNDNLTETIALSQAVVYLDSPATTSATTYKFQWKVANAGETLYFNRTSNTTGYYASTITAIEVAA